MTKTAKPVAKISMLSPTLFVSNICHQHGCSLDNNFWFLDDFWINLWMIYRFLMLLVHFSVRKFRFFVLCEAILMPKLFFCNAKDVKRKSHCYECHQDEEIRRGNWSCQSIRVRFPIYLVLVIQDVYFVNFVLQFITIPEYKAHYSNFLTQDFWVTNSSLFGNRCEQAAEPHCIMLTVSSTDFNIKKLLYGPSSL